MWSHNSIDQCILICLCIPRGTRGPGCVQCFVLGFFIDLFFPLWTPCFFVLSDFFLFYFCSHIAVLCWWIKWNASPPYIVNILWSHVLLLYYAISDLKQTSINPCCFINFLLYLFKNPHQTILEWRCTIVKYTGTRHCQILKNSSTINVFTYSLWQTIFTHYSIHILEA